MISSFTVRMAAVVFAGLLTAGCGSDSGSPAPAPSPPRADSAATAPFEGDAEPSEVDESAMVPGPLSPYRHHTPRGQRPVRLSIPAIAVDAPMTELGVNDDGTLEVPDNGADVGWLRSTPSPGQQGPAVVAGHVDTTTGPAVFARLGEVSVGDPVVVTRGDGTTVEFAVDAVRRYAQSKFPTATVYGPVPVPALRLITCAGAYDASRGGYQDNVVVYAS